MAVSGSSILAAILPGVVEKLWSRKKGADVSNGDIARAALGDAVEGLTTGKKTSAAGLATVAGALNLDQMGIDPSSLEGLAIQGVMFLVAAVLLLYRQKTA